jgi:hypothetical protein
MDTRDPSLLKEMSELEMIMFGLKWNWNQYSPWVFLSWTMCRDDNCMVLWPCKNQEAGFTIIVKPAESRHAV